jgi:carbamoyltransferase
MLPNISIHESHNASITLELNNEILEIIELERLFGIKNYSLHINPERDLKTIVNYIESKYKFTEYDTLLTTKNAINAFQIDKYFKYKNLKIIEHHYSHASGTFYQSPFETALIISYDGGGDDGYFNIYLADRSSGVRLIYTTYEINLGMYFYIGVYTPEVNSNPNNLGEYLDFMGLPGKLMAYSSLGTVQEDMIPEITNLYTYVNKPNEEWYVHHKRTFGNKLLGMTDSQYFRNLSATNQHVFEDLFFKYAEPHILEHKLPICLTGGCALNITLNTKIKNKYNLPVYIAPNPSDCGISSGMMLSHIKPKSPIDLRYMGANAYDEYMLPMYVKKYNGKTISEEDLAEILTMDDCVVGIFQGRSEHGPRALGNRSFISLATNLNIKDKINFEIKFREWFRPVAPLIRLQDLHRYFDWDVPCPTMNFSPTIRSEYKEMLRGILHLDDTARVQTITEEQNPFLYKVLTILEQKNKIPVLVNTSFNIQGQPLVSTYTDAFKLYETLPINGMYVDGFFFSKLSYTESSLL